MCGIAGIFSQEITEHHRNIANAIMQSQYNRGPDHQDMITIVNQHSQIILAHNRLSIIDLSAVANQPMWDNSQRFCIVYNGEIYNYIELQRDLAEKGYIFKTKSDTEVILNAFSHWGIKALDYLQGPFAFAIYDNNKEELWLCRDRFSVRPLFYTIHNDTLYFASSTREIAKALKYQPNLSYIAKGSKYLVYDDNSAETAYENMYALPGSHYLKLQINNGKLNQSIHRYYNLQEKVKELKNELQHYTANDYLEKFANTLDHAIKIRLRSDVPIALSLSSGLDSSSIAALVNSKQKITGFSFGHPDQTNTEGPLIRQCAKYIGLNIEYIHPQPADMISGLLKTLDAQDAPFSSMSIVAQYLLYEQVKKQGYKVLLGGQGGDESLMGYRKFMLMRLQQFIKNKNIFSSIKYFLTLLPMFFAEAQQVRQYWQHRHRFLNKERVQTLLNLPAPPKLHLTLTNTLWERQLQDIEQFSLPTLLRYEDRNAMANSVESRLPFLDHHLIELGCALPDEFKLQRGYGKWPLRALMKHQLPNQIRLARYKRGFDIPLHAMMQHGLGKMIRELLHTSQIKSFLKPNINITNDFSDNQLMLQPSRMTDAITLLWLNKVVQ